MNAAALKRLFPWVLGRQEANTAISTAGAGTLTAASLVGGVITRTGPSADFTDTTATAALIIAGMPSAGNPVIGQSWELTYLNTVAYTCTLAAGTGVTLSGITSIPGLSSARFLVTYTASGAVTILGLGAGSYGVSLPAAKYVTQAYQGVTLAAGDITGANVVWFNNTGTTPAALTVRTAAQMFADTPNAQVGQSWSLFIRNSSVSANTATLTADAGPTVTLTGTMTIAQNVTRMFVCTFTSATALTIQSMGVSAAAA